MSSVILIGARSSRMSVLNRALIEYGFEVVFRQEGVDDLLTSVSLHSPDILILGLETPDQKVLEALSTLNQKRPLPVVMFVEQTSENIVQRAIQSGVNAYIVADLQPQRLKTIIDVAVARFHEYQTLKVELEQTKSRLEDRKILDRAKGMLMDRQKINEEEAYRALRKMAMDKGETLSVVAKNVIDVLQLLDEKVV